MIQACRARPTGTYDFGDSWEHVLTVEEMNGDPATFDAAHVDLEELDRTVRGAGG